MITRKSTACGLDPGTVRDLLDAAMLLLGPAALLSSDQAARAYELRPVLGALIDLGAERPLTDADLRWGTGELTRRAAR